MTFLEKVESVLIKPQGRLDLSAGTDLQQQISALESTQYSLWILDLALVDFVDSAGLLALVSSWKAANRNQSRLVVCNVCPAVRLIFEITQLDRVIDIFESYDELAETVQKPALLEVLPESQIAA